VISFIKKVQDVVRRPRDLDGPLQSALYGARDTLLGRIKDIAAWVRELASNGLSSQATADVIAKTEDEASLARTGQIQEVDPQLINEGAYVKFLRKNLEQSLVRWYSNLYFSASQIMTDVHALTKVRALFCFWGNSWDRICREFNFQSDGPIGLNIF